MKFGSMAAHSSSKEGFNVRVTDATAPPLDVPI
uniref:Uncharacterized protein n=1 Tax=Lepeophtheirus salmonis TaxID=72036 RepID=A0A0K2T1N2_LEPSM